jgi:hypothetical protein
LDTSAAERRPNTLAVLRLLDRSGSKVAEPTRAVSAIGPRAKTRSVLPLRAGIRALRAMEF